MTNDRYLVQIVDCPTCDGRGWFNAQPDQQMECLECEGYGEGEEIIEETTP